MKTTSSSGFEKLQETLEKIRQEEFPEVSKNLLMEILNTEFLFMEDSKAGYDQIKDLIVKYFAKEGD